MFAVKRNQVLVTVLAVMVAVAGYVNFANSSELPTGKKRPDCSWTIRLQECVRPHLCLTGLSSAVACCSELGPRPTWRRVRVRISTNCQGRQQ